MPPSPKPLPSSTLDRRALLLSVGALAAAGPAFGAEAARCAAGSTLKMMTRDWRAVAGPAEAELKAWKGQFQPLSFAGSSGGGTLPYRLAAPSGAGRLPLVIVLHGSGSIGTDNESQLGVFAAAWGAPEIRSGAPAVVAVPQMGGRTVNYEPDPDGQPASLLGPSFTLLVDFIDAMAKDPRVDPARVCIVGFSMGASTSLQLALRAPGRFAAVAAFSPIPPPRALAPQLARQRLMIVHGDADAQNPYAAEEKWLAALACAGSQATAYRYREMGHRVPDDMVAALEWRQWLLGQDPSAQA